MNTPNTHLGGAVLAGGESRRMGRDKALIAVNGEPLWQRQVRVLGGAGAQPVVVVRRRAQGFVSNQVPHVWDAVEDAGPLAGLHAALANAPTRWLAVLAVDLPAVDSAWFRQLYGLCEPGVGAVAAHARGFEPLAAIYPRSAWSLVTEHLRQGNYSLQKLVTALISAGHLKVTGVPPAELGRWANCNTPTELLSHPW